MANGSNSIPPPGDSPELPQNDHKVKKPSNPGEFHFQKAHDWLGMHFSADQWNKFMNILLKNLNQFIVKTMKKMTEKMKKDWKRGEGKDVQ